MNKTSFWALTKREFFSYINSPLAYVVIVPFLLLSTFLFFRTALVMGDANLRPFFELLPWFLIVIAPALAMKTFAEEYRKDTLELLFAHPVSEWTIAAAKFSGLSLFFGLLLLTTLSLPLTLVLFSQPDLGLLFSQYLAGFLIGAAFLAVGMATSAFVRSSIGSFLLGVAISFALMLIGMNFVVLMFPGNIGRIISEVAILSHLTNLSRGVLDLRDVLYFLSIIGIALAATVYKLSERTVAEQPSERRRLAVVLGLLVLVGVTGNVLMYAYPLRIDLTSSRQFSLSQGTKQVLKGLPDRLTITLYTSRNLPGPMQATLRDTSDRLKDFSRYSKRVALKTVIVDDNASLREEALRKGVREVQFNQIATGSFQVQTGFLGLVLRYGDKSETIDFITDASDLEYQLSRLINKMTREKDPTVGLAAATTSSQMQLFEDLLRKQYQVVNLSDTSTESSFADLAAVVIVDDGSQENASMAGMIRQYALNGGNVLLFANGANVNSGGRGLLSATKSESALRSVLSDFGMEVLSQIAYDWQQNELVRTENALQNYPFWIRALLNTKVTPWTGGTQSVVMGWPSPVSISETQGLTPEPLVTTTRAAGVQEDSFSIALDQISKLERAVRDPVVLGAIAEKGSQRVAAIGNMTMVTDDFLQNSGDNVSFTANMVDWISADPVLLTIPKRAAGRNLFRFDNPAQIQLVQFANLLIPPFVVGLFGAWWLRRRRRLSRRQFGGF